MSSPIKFRAHPYQRRAIRWVEDHPRCCLFMEMGLGKTVVALTAAQNLILSGDVDRVLVIAPKKVAESTWSNEVGKWAHLAWLRVSCILGTAAQRRKALAADAEIYVTSRDNVVWLVNECNGVLPYDMIVLDELTSFKSSRARRSKALRLGSLQTVRVVGLTGTPTPNGLYDLWGLMACIDKGVRLGRFITKFRQRWFDVIEHNHIPIRITPKKGAQAEIMNLIRDICLSMRTKDYLTLPAMIETDVPVALPERIMKSYRRFERDKVLEYKNSAEAEKGSATLITNGAATLLGKLTQYASGAIYAEDGSVIDIHSEKLERLKELVETADGPMLCFYQYKHEATRIKEALKGVRVETYSDKRQLDQWNAGEIDVLLAHPSSTAFGLNMQQGGSLIVWFTPTWNLELYQQANARLHRQGQTQQVRVFRLMAAGTTDERILAAINAKASGQNAIMQILAGL